MPADADSQSRQSARLPRPKNLYISGTVVHEDGSVPSSGVVIERTCSGRTRKEAYLDSNGGFMFQTGAQSTVSADASDVLSQPVGPMDGATTRSEATGWAELTGCELRARLAGYRSNVVNLDGLRSLGQVDVGTIVLRPLAKIQGTKVSVTSLAAPKKAQKDLARAHVEINMKSDREAEKRLRSAVELYPKYAEAWLELGNVHRRLGQLADAREDYGCSIEADAKFVPPYIELGRIAILEEKWQEAAAVTNKALILDPLDFPEGLLMNSLANYNLDRLDEAERSALRLQRLDGLHRLPLVHVVLAGIFERRRDPAAAAVQLRSYLKYAPDASNASEVRAHLLQLEGAAERSARALPEPPR